MIFYNFGRFVCKFITFFFGYPDPDQRILMRIRIRANDTDPTGSGSETLLATKVEGTQLGIIPSSSLSLAMHMCRSYQFLSLKKKTLIILRI